MRPFLCFFYDFSLPNYWSDDHETQHRSTMGDPGCRKTILEKSPGCGSDDKNLFNIFAGNYTFYKRIILKFWT